MLGNALCSVLPIVIQIMGVTWFPMPALVVDWCCDPGLICMSLILLK